MKPVKTDASWSGLLRSIKEYAAPRMAGTLTIILIASLVEGAGLILLLPIADLIFSGSDSTGPAAVVMMRAFGAIGLPSVMQQLAFLCAAFLLLMLFRAFILLRRDAVLSELSQGYVDRLRKKLFMALAKAEWSSIKQMQRAHLLDNMTTNIARVAIAMRFLSQSVVMALMVAVYLVSGFVIDWAVGLLLLFITFAVCVAGIVWSRRSRSLGQVMTLRNRAIMDETTRFLQGLKAAKACQASHLFAERFGKSIDDARMTSVQFVRQQGRMRRTVEMLGAVAAVSLLMIGYGLLNLSGAELLVMGAVVIRLMPGLLSLLSGIQSMSYALPAFSSAERIRVELEAVREDKSERLYMGSFAEPQPISLETVRMESGSTCILQTAQIEIPATGLVHVCGPSGAGKSTFAELLAGLNLPGSGTARRGGVILDRSSRAAWQSQMAFAPQEPFLFAGTVRENLLWPDVQADDAAIMAALDAAEASDLVRCLPDGLDHALQDDGSRLSGGERQRLCLARALLRPSSLLIVDEATSAVDSELEERIIRNLHALAKTKTVVFASHSGTIRQYADTTVAIDRQGIVSVQGSDTGS